MSRAASACPRAHRTRIPLAAVTALLVGTLIAGRALGATAKPAEGGLDIASGSTSRDVALLASTDIEASVHRGEEPALVGSATLSVSSDYAADIISVSVASGSDVAGVTVTVAASGCTNAACVADAPVELRVGMRPTPLLHVADGTITPSVGTSAISYVASTSPTAAAGATARYVVVFTIGPDPAAVAPAPPPTADPTPTPDPTADPTPTPTPDPTADPTPTPTPDPTADPTPTPAPTADPTPTPTPDPTADPTPPIESTPTPEPTPPPDPTPSVQPATDPTSTPDPQGIESPSLARAALTGDPPSG